MVKYLPFKLITDKIAYINHRILILNDEFMNIIYICPFHSQTYIYFEKVKDYSASFFGQSRVFIGRVRLRNITISSSLEILRVVKINVAFP